MGFGFGLRVAGLFIIIQLEQAVILVKSKTRSRRKRTCKSKRSEPKSLVKGLEMTEVVMVENSN